MTLKHEANELFTEYFYGTLFGLIRIEKNVIYLHSIYNKEKHNGYFQKFMNFVSNSKRNLILLEVRNKSVYDKLIKIGYTPINEVKVGEIIFRNCLTKNPIT